MTASEFETSPRGPGVTAMLVNRYFGSKEQLFEEVVEVVFSEFTVSLKQFAMLAKFARPTQTR